MEVNGPSSVDGASGIKPVQQTSETANTAESAPIAPEDEVDISPAAQMMDTLNQASELRSERLAQIKADIDAGVYETPEKLEAALTKMLGEIGMELEE